MPNIMDDFPSKYLKSSDVDDHPTATISHVGREEVGRDREMKPILYVQEFDKGIVLNKTNANAISKLYGQDTDDWPGKTVVIGTAPVDFGGESTVGIRIWPPKRQAPKQSANRPLNPIPNQQEATSPAGVREFAPLPDDEEIPF